LSEQRFKQRKAQLRGVLCDLVRDVFGDPFHPWRPRPEWLAAQDGAARTIADCIDGSGDFGAMPVLADALEDAGCTDAAVLEHCRDRTKPHVRGACWVLDRLLGR